MPAIESQPIQRHGQNQYGGANHIVVRRIRAFDTVQAFPTPPVRPGPGRMAEPTTHGSTGQHVFHAISLATVLYGLWLLLSGHYTTMLMIIGGICAVFVVAIAIRMDVVDHESHPVRLGFRVFGYWRWLIWQIFWTNLDVARRILSPSLPIQPELFVVRTSQRSELGQVIYANSITLTPGTVTIEEKNGELIVHALTRSSAEEIRSGKMDRKVSAIEGHE